MEGIVTIIILLVGVIGCLYLLFRFAKFIFTNKRRIIITFSLVGFVLLLIVINHFFFKKMEVIQSKVYPNLYIIKNPIRDKDSLKKIIKEKVIEKLNTEFIGNENEYKIRYIIKKEEFVELNYNISFYEFYTGGLLTEGTAWFINHEEDPGGFSSEYLSDYSDYFIAAFNANYCENDTINYKGVMHFKSKFKVKSDTLMNHCK